MKRSRRTRRLITLALTTAAATAALAAVGAVSPPSPAAAQTAGQIRPCPGSPWGNGWFNTWGNGKAGAVNCSQHDNHIVLDIYNSQGLLTRAGVDLWFGHQCDWPRFLQPTPGYPFKIRLANNGYGTLGQPGCHTQGIPINTTGGALYSSWATATTVRTWQCHLQTTNRQCGQIEGYTDFNTRGINQGPYVMYGLVGYGPGSSQSTYTTDVVVYLQT